MATVVYAVYAFTDLNKDAWIYAAGSTSARTRLYRMGINKFFNEVRKNFEIYGLYKNEWIDFDNETEFDAFVVRRVSQ